MLMQLPAPSKYNYLAQKWQLISDQRFSLDFDKYILVENSDSNYSRTALQAPPTMLPRGPLVLADLEAASVLKDPSFYANASFDATTEGGLVMSLLYHTVHGDLQMKKFHAVSYVYPLVAK